MVVGILLTYAFSYVHPLGSQVATVTVNTTTATPGDAVAVADKLGPSVGTIIASLSGSKTGLGTGFVFAKDAAASYLVTNNHVTTGALTLHVAMESGHNYTATLIGADAEDDLAVVSVPDSSLPVATFGQSSTLKAGQEVIAIGSPLGNAGSITRGVISALHRTIDASGEGASSSETLQDVLQTDASIDPGNSGGPLADGNGNVVGINVAFAGSTSKIGYSIPSDLARGVATTLLAKQKVQHPFLGVAYLTAIEAIEAGQGFDGAGVLVSDVTANTPAASAGFKKGDILVAVDGVSIDNGETLGGLIQPKKVGEQVTFTVKRSGSTTTLTATLVERPAPAP